MLNTLLIGLALVGAAPEADAPLERPEPVTGDAARVEKAADLAVYNGLREKTPNNAAAQWKLALWCEEHGLPAEAAVHFTRVAQLDPGREAAWKKLGYKKVRGRWVTEAQLAEEARQKRADRIWALTLRRIHKDIHGGKHRAEAAAELAKIEEPRAIPSVYREFGAGRPADQEIAIQVLGQIKTPLSSKVMAVLAVYGKSAEVRRHARETLRGREPEEFLAILVNLLSDPMKYEVKPVGGPGSPGVLFVEGERFNLRRFYAPPLLSVKFQPGDIVSYDENGIPGISRPRVTLGIETVPTGPNGKGSSLAIADTIAVRYTLPQLLAESQRAAISAQWQLQADVAAVEAINQDRSQFNALVIGAASQATNLDLGDDPKEWRRAVAKERPYKRAPARQPVKPTIDELVPLAYMPRFGELTFLRAPSTGDS